MLDIERSRELRSCEPRFSRNCLSAAPGFPAPPLLRIFLELLDQRILRLDQIHQPSSSARRARDDRQTADNRGSARTDQISVVSLQQLRQPRAISGTDHFAAKPIPPSRALPMTFSRPSNAPPQNEQDVAGVDWTIPGWECLRPPCGARAIVPRSASAALLHAFPDNRGDRRVVRLARIFSISSM